MKTKKGFTLIELLVVISIIALLSSIIFASLNSAKTKAQATLITQNFYQLETAMSLYQDSNNQQVIQQCANPHSTAECGVTTDYPEAFYATLKPLVDNGFISSIAQNPINPANDNGSTLRLIYSTEYPSVQTNTRALGWWYFACGTQPFDTYTLIVSDPNGLYGSLLNMPKLTYYDASVVPPVPHPEYNLGDFNNSYCLTNTD